MVDKIMIMYEGRTYVVFEDDISEKLWQELKDNISLTTEDSFKPKDGGSSYWTFDAKRDRPKATSSPSASPLLDYFVFLLGVSTAIALSGYLIYGLLKN
jgi:hypothetical protein